MSANHKDATFYAQVEPEWSSWTNYDGEKQLRGAKVVRVTQEKPKRPLPGVVLVKLTIRVPSAAFLPLRPEAVVVIPEEMTAASLPIEVEAGDPT
jgi:hypothetical protein